MKNILKILFISMLVFNLLCGYSQNIAVTDDDGYTADPSAMLDVKSINKGLLVPRLTTIQRTGISNPAAGLMVYDTDVQRFFFYTGGGWQDVSDQGLWALKGKDIILSDTTYNVSIGSKKTAGKFTVKGDQNIGVNEPLFSVVNTSGDTIFAVYSEGVRIYVNDEPGKASGNKGGFAVGGFTPSKGGVTNEFFRVTADSIRVYVDTTRSSKASGNKGGFAVGGFSPSKGIIPYKYLSVTDDSVRIYIEQPKTKASGNKGGFAVGGFTPSKAGGSNKIMHVMPDSTKILTGKGDTTYMKITPQNTFIGYGSGINTKPSGTNGLYNAFIGHEAGFLNSSGSSSVYLGDHSGYNAKGSYNIFIGKESGYKTENNYNVFIGHQSGASNINGTNDVFLGFMAGNANTSGTSNMFIGYNAGLRITTGNYNTFLGSSSGEYSTTGEKNLYLGYQAGYGNQTGSGNICIGSYAGYKNLVSNRLFIENYLGTQPWLVDSTNSLIFGRFDQDWLRFNNKVGIGRNPVTYALEVNGDAYKTGGTGLWQIPSDKRIKTNISDIENAKGILMQLHPVKYRYTDEWLKLHPSIKDKLYYNFIAQEYSEVFPESVNGSGEFLKNDKQEILMMDAYNAQIVTIKAVQELIKENDELKKTVSSQKDEIKNLRTENNEIREEIIKIRNVLNMEAKKE